MSPKNLITLAFLFLLIKILSAQTPTADPLTGTSNVSIPVWSIKSGALSVPIGIEYSRNGMRVNEGESTAGIGWSVVMGDGMVVRDLRGLPDDFVGAKSGLSGDTRNGWLHGSNAAAVNSFSSTGNLNYSTSDCADEASDWTQLNNFGYINDTEPDVFSFFAPGLNGKFIFDHSKLIRTVPYQDVKIDLVRGGTDSLINQITITNNNGVIYTFQAGDKVTRSTFRSLSGNVNFFSSSYKYTSSLTATFYRSWYLTKIESPEGGLIQYTYGNDYDFINHDYVEIVNETYNKVDSLYSINERTIGKALLTVTGSNEKATFTWVGSMVGAISISELTYNSNVRKYNLGYEYIKSSKLNKSRPKRAFLTSFKEEVNCNVFPGYAFDYYGINFVMDTTAMPFDSPYRQDLFGYYNAVSTSRVPEIYIAAADAGQNGERYRIAAASNYSLMASGGNRAVSAAFNNYGALKKVTYPSGGFSQITYEPAEYYDAVTNTNQYGAGVRVKSILTSANDPKSDVAISYKYNQFTIPSRSSGQWTYKPMFVALSYGQNAARTPTNLAPEQQILYSRVEVSVTGRGKTVYEFQNAAMYPTSAFQDFGASLTKLARLNQTPCADVSVLRSGYYTYPYAPNTNYMFERGLPTRISQYTRAGKLVQRTLNTFQRTTLPVAVVSGIKFEQVGNVFQFQKYNLLSNINKVALTETTRAYELGTDTVSANFAESVKTIIYNGNQMVSEVSTQNSDNTVVKNTIKYAKDYALNGTDLQSQMIAGLVNANRHGTPIESVSFNGTTVIGANLTLFNNNFGGNRILPWQTLMLGDPTSFAPSTITSGVFVKSPNYLATGFFDTYDIIGNLTLSHNLARYFGGVIMGYKNSMPALAISNAKNTEVAFSDFEPYSASTLTTTGALSTAEFRAGKKSVSLSSSANIQQLGVIRGIGKYYRFNAYVKSSGQAVISILINGSVVDTVLYPASAVNNWRFKDKAIDMSMFSVAVGALFDFKVTTSANVYIDNLVFFPETADISIHSYDPLIGKTSTQGSRGIASFTEYDSQGRLRYVKNTDQDILLIKDYHYKSPQGVAPVSSFSGNFTPNMGTATTYTANPSCVGGVTYAWYVDGVNQNISTVTLTYTFTQNKDYRILLIANSNFGSTSTEVLIKPIPVINATITVTNGGTTFNCRENDFTRYLTLNLGGCYEQTNTLYEIKGTCITQNPNGTPTYYTSNVFTIYLCSGSNNTFTIYVTTTCFNETTKAHDVVTKSVTVNFTWQVVSPC